MGQTTSRFLPRSELPGLLHYLKSQGYECVGPQIDDDAIVYRSITDVAQLPQGMHDQQTPGAYAYTRSESPRQFAWANGAQCLKPLVFAPRETLWCSTLEDGQLSFSQVDIDSKPTAVIGVRPCDLAALALSDAHFLHSDVADKHYRTRREQLFLVAINCSHPAETCFCASTGDGPSINSGADLILDELDDGFICRADSKKGEALLAQLACEEVTEQHQQLVTQQQQHAVESQTRKVENMHGVLAGQATHQKWNEIAERCLSCGNCTSVCPTCFCNSQQEQPSLDLNQVDQVRQWDSCFHTDHSYIHGFVVRSATAHRYRQWLTHKFDYWHDQYGRSGCVGCGRCITWCPVGIDVTVECGIFAEESGEQ